MNGFQIKAAAVNFGLTPDPANGLISSSWQVAATGDVNSDGRDDIVWRDPNTGGTALWLVHGTNSLTPTVPSQAQAAIWTLKGMADFNADGKEDILWHDNTNQVQAWLMDGATVASTVNMPAIGQDWKLTGLSDGTGDGIPDIYWTKGGQVVIWEFGGTTDTLTGGSGRDVFKLQNTTDVSNLITDFEAGPSRDMLDLRDFMTSIGMPGVNGLAAGVVRTTQDGAATHVRADIDPGPGTNWATLATLQNVTASAITPDDWLF